MPTSECPLALERLRALRDNPAQADKITVGCPWYVDDKASNFCFFAYAAENDHPHDTIDLVSLLRISQTNIYSSLTRAIETVKAVGLTDLLKEENDG